MRRGTWRNRLTEEELAKKKALDKKFAIVVFGSVLIVIAYLVYHLIIDSNIKLNF